MALWAELRLEIEVGERKEEEDEEGESGVVLVVFEVGNLVVGPRAAKVDGRIEKPGYRNVSFLLHRCFTL